MTMLLICFMFSWTSPLSVRYFYKFLLTRTCSQPQVSGSSPEATPPNMRCPRGDDTETRRWREAVVQHNSLVCCVMTSPLRETTSPPVLCLVFLKHTNLTYWTLAVAAKQNPKNGKNKNSFTFGSCSWHSVWSHNMAMLHAAKEWTCTQTNKLITYNTMIFHLLSLISQSWHKSSEVWFLRFLVFIFLQLYTFSLFLSWFVCS